MISRFKTPSYDNIHLELSANNKGRQLVVHLLDNHPNKIKSPLFANNIAPAFICPIES